MRFASPDESDHFSLFTESVIQPFKDWLLSTKSTLVHLIRVLDAQLAFLFRSPVYFVFKHGGLTLASRGWHVQLLMLLLATFQLSQTLQR